MGPRSPTRGTGSRTASLQTQGWSEEEKERLQALVETMHRSWPADGQYLPPPTRGVLVELDGALLLTPPEGLEVGYVPIVTSQRVRSG